MTERRELRTDARPLTGGRRRAALAWRRLDPRAPQPRRVTTAKRSAKSVVYRLDLGDDQPAVVAKRSSPPAAQREAHLYRKILSRQPASVLAFYGLVEEPTRDCAWLFVEDAGAERYGPHTLGYPALGARWLADLHRATTWDAPPPGVEPRGAEYYHDHCLVPVCATLDEVEGRKAGAAGAGVALRQLRARLHELAGEWDSVAAFCRRIPHCLVHGDFVDKNIGVLCGNAASRLVPYDWETAGYGPPAADVACAGDWQVYAVAMAPSWPQLRQEDFCRLARAGAVFRVLACLQWRSAEWRTPWVDREVATLKIYLERLERALAAWRDPL